MALFDILITSTQVLTLTSNFLIFLFYFSFFFNCIFLFCFAFLNFYCRPVKELLLIITSTESILGFLDIAGMKVNAESATVFAKITQEWALLHVFSSESS